MNILDILDINNLSFIMMISYKKESFDIPQTCYLDYSPVSNPSSSYRTIQPSRQDPLCYIKSLHNDEWLYESPTNTLKFMPLQQYYSGFIYYKPPAVFYIDYLANNEFVLYKNESFGNQLVLYIRYDPANNSFSWVSDKQFATKFKYGTIEWTQLLTNNWDSMHKIASK
jgi:hypothetical protein